MTLRPPEPLSAERDGPEELQWVRDQARFFHTMRESPFPLDDLVLLPACAVCASSDVVETPMDAAYVCRKCGSKSSAIRPHVGRLARR